MTREQFDNLVRSVESRVGSNPAALKRRVIALALAGYSLLLAMLVVVVLVAAGFVVVACYADLEGRIVCGVAAALVLLAGGAAVLRALLVSIKPPEGVPVLREDAPRLYAELDRLRHQLHSTQFHHLLLVPEHNAAAVQVPRLGVLGWSRNYLLLGLPLLEGHPLPELRAILAHELAHLSRRHGRFSHWIYRLRRSWERIFEEMSRPEVRQQSSLRPLLEKCVGAFWPRFNAHAFVFSRANEYEADALAARLAGRDALEHSLVRLALQSRVLGEKFWPETWKQANQQSTPPLGTFTRLREVLRQEPPEREAWLAEAFRVPTTNADTHPCLSDRLRGVRGERPVPAPNTNQPSSTSLDTIPPLPGPLPACGEREANARIILPNARVANTHSSSAGEGRGEEVVRAPALGEGNSGSSATAVPVESPPTSTTANALTLSAADELFGLALPKYRQQVEELWRKQVTEVWSARHAKAGALTARLTALQQAVSKPEADVDSLSDKARVVLDLEGDEAAEPLLRQILALNPKHIPANFHLGRILLDRGLNEGQAHLEAALAADDDLLPQACELLCEHFRRLGRLDELRKIEARLDRYEKDLAASRAERREVSARDPLIPHELSATELHGLKETLAAEREFARAWLGRKQLRFFPRQKLFLLCVQRRSAWYALPSDARDQALVNRFTQTVRLPGRVLIFTPRGSYRALARKLKRVPQSAL